MEWTNWIDNELPLLVQLAEDLLSVLAFKLYVERVFYLRWVAGWRNSRKQKPVGQKFWERSFLIVNRKYWVLTTTTKSFQYHLEIFAPWNCQDRSSLLVCTSILDLRVSLALAHSTFRMFRTDNWVNSVCYTPYVAMFFLGAKTGKSSNYSMCIWII